MQKWRETQEMCYASSMSKVVWHTCLVFVGRGAVWGVGKESKEPPLCQLQGRAVCGSETPTQGGGQVNAPQEGLQICRNAQW